MSSIRARTAAWLGLTLGLLLLGAGWLLDARLSERLVEHFDASLRARARAIATLVLEDEDGLELAFADEVMPGYGASEGTGCFEVWETGGGVLERSRSLDGRDLPRAGLAAPATRIADLALPDGRAGRAVWERTRAHVEGRDEATGELARGRAVEVAVALPRAPLDAELARLHGTLLVAGALILLGVLASVALSLRLGLRSLDELGERVRAVDAGGSALALDGSALPSELRPIVASLSGLLARLDETLRRERRTTADIAHELRTPIAELQAASELALRHPEDEELARRALRSAHEIAREMGGTVGALLQIARLEAGAVALRPDEVDLHELVRAVVGPRARAAAEKGLSIVIEDGPGPRARTDRELLAIVLGNLVGNSLEYTPPGGRIEIECRSDARGARLSVRNDQRGLEPADAERLMQPFWRKDEPRGAREHAGLGLTLVREAARVLGLFFGVEVTPQSFVASLVFPAEPARPPADALGAFPHA